MQVSKKSYLRRQSGQTLRWQYKHISIRRWIRRINVLPRSLRHIQEAKAEDLHDSRRSSGKIEWNRHKYLVTLSWCWEREGTAQKEISLENYPNSQNDIGFQTQEAHTTPHRLNQTGNTPWHIIVRVSKYKVGNSLKSSTKAEMSELLQTLISTVEPLVHGVDNSNWGCWTLQTIFQNWWRNNGVSREIQIKEIHGSHTCTIESLWDSLQRGKQRIP